MKIFLLNDLNSALRTSVKITRSFNVDNSYDCHQFNLEFEPVQSKVVAQISSILAFGFLAIERNFFDCTSNPTLNELIKNKPDPYEVCSSVLDNVLKDLASNISASGSISTKEALEDYCDEISWDACLILAINDYEYKFKICIDYPDFSTSPKQIASKSNISIELNEVKVLSATDPNSDCITALSQLHSCLVCLFE
ncbi:hypothetical protein [Pseudoalteromonas sp. BDTF-M6]|uniref:hypothetical protein n=1 Tax=Pseudoalteromonas sp. BDTF-M6 TaxID=2796132 RepID=UPI001BB0959B|nr:hypothetical protein [Pseudoalteromonas sp. BDTF-M6]MBS3798115.1 hypothetical protein [Pseudoalteromonas sp. BDTF-M6]